MRISCPYCGERELGEFSYLGDASPKRPAVIAADGGVAPDAEDVFYDYVYLRDNVAGEMSEHWYHGGGCRSWLVVRRNTVSHEIKSVEIAAGAGARTGHPNQERANG
ncbi:sarcosine oxidase subunit delta [Pseudaminobacter sp. 19-2017]|uniref:Sarcosine oxidase subunit delta n=1 Tax=Pseudaminobacter soli (ex Zhang et al. 2022) TaxID=2831468 RepID=A0A942DWK7_9HYPH|nr:sarcosine oxidase subunit delta [Pseudaminobacter soli]MBS3648328.1 sarcosine oxidase subunit delta [Pseudaminobacter soli]